jgi:hypothetical protein
VLLKLFRVLLSQYCQLFFVRQALTFRIAVVRLLEALLLARGVVQDARGLHAVLFLQVLKIKNLALVFALAASRSTCDILASSAFVVFAGLLG